MASFPIPEGYVAADSPEGKARLLGFVADLLVLFLQEKGELPLTGRIPNPGAVLKHPVTREPDRACIRPDEPASIAIIVPLEDIVVGPPDTTIP